MITHGGVLHALHRAVRGFQAKGKVLNCFITRLKVDPPPPAAAAPPPPPSAAAGTCENGQEPYRHLQQQQVREQQQQDYQQQQQQQGEGLGAAQLANRQDYWQQEQQGKQVDVVCADGPSNGCSHVNMRGSSCQSYIGEGAAAEAAAAAGCGSTNTCSRTMCPCSQGLSSKDFVKGISSSCCCCCCSKGVRSMGPAAAAADNRCLGEPRSADCMESSQIVDHSMKSCLSCSRGRAAGAPPAAAADKSCLDEGSSDCMGRSQLVDPSMESCSSSSRGRAAGAAAAAAGVPAAAGAAAAAGVPAAAGAAAAAAGVPAAAGAAAAAGVPAAAGAAADKSCLDEGSAGRMGGSQVADLSTKSISLRGGAAGAPAPDSATGGELLARARGWALLEWNVSSHLEEAGLVGAAAGGGSGFGGSARDG